ncbi:MAG: hypothetical protein HYZ53_26835 [Planctomycetes bacterium]|nr:hypothetical protein [Planctomycetota bacterium]
MKTASIREFRDHATEMLRAKEPILVLRRGELAGIFFPHPSTSLPLEFKRELYGELSAAIAKSLVDKGVTEEDVLKDFRVWRKERREARRRR